MIVRCIDNKPVRRRRMHKRAVAERLAGHGTVPAVENCILLSQSADDRHTLLIKTVHYNFVLIIGRLTTTGVDKLIEVVSSITDALNVSALLLEQVEMST